MPRTFWVYLGDQVPKITKGRVQPGFYETTAESFFAALGYVAKKNGNYATRYDIHLLQEMAEREEFPSGVILAYDPEQGPKPPDRVSQLSSY